MRLPFQAVFVLRETCTSFSWDFRLAFAQVKLFESMRAYLRQNLGAMGRTGKSSRLYSVKLGVCCLGNPP